jgi:PTH2 family peptidyl-tRNA hydrolase
MRKGKLAAQVGHASQSFMLHKHYYQNYDSPIINVSFDMTPEEYAWVRAGTPKIVVSCANEAELEELSYKAQLARLTVHKVTDFGLTEFHGVPTVTCAAFGPNRVEDVDKITGHLKLL